MSKLLFDESPVIVDRKLAKALGLNEAIVVQQIHYWLKINEKKGTNFINGRYWTYNSLKIWHENDFSFWSFDTVRRTFAKLEEIGILIIGNFNEDRRDRTKWYSINYEKLEELMAESKCAKCTNANVELPNANVQNAQMPEGANVQNAQMQNSKMHRPLPEITTEISYTENNNNNNKTVLTQNADHEEKHLSENCENIVVVKPKIDDLKNFCDKQGLVCQEEFIESLLDIAAGNIERIKNVILAVLEYCKKDKRKERDISSLIAAGVREKWKPNGNVNIDIMKKGKKKDKYQLLYTR